MPNEEQQHGEDREMLSVFVNKQHPHFAVNGAFGGVVPTGDQIVATLYLEQFTVPIAGSIAVNGDSGAITGEEYERRSDIERVIQCSIALSPVAAKRIGEWMIKHASQILGTQGGSSNE